MKVVLFCGGLGTRLREHAETIPKPLVNIGPRPIIWHLMKYYAHHGHKDFVLCLGYRGEMLREYFLNYNECMSNDFTLHDGGQRIEVHSRDIEDWSITFVDTGLHSNIGQRLMAVRDYVGDDEMFLANYSDGLSNVPLEQMLDLSRSSNAAATFVSVKPAHSFHSVQTDADGRVTDMGLMNDSGVRLNGGFFVLRNEVFDFMQPGEEFVEQPFERMRAAGRLYALEHEGFWAAMDTFKDKISFERLFAKNDRPWQVWR